MDIKKLDSEVISKIRSSFNITSVAQCVFELVCNSLDAKSTSVAVRINLVTFKIQVADNGEGITKENMDLLGVRYATNKCWRLKDLDRNLKTYGFRGETIASIVEMCRSVTVSSKSKTSSETYSISLSKEFKSESKLTKPRASAGTTVTVLEWLSAVPVRQQRIVQEIELEEVKKQLESLVVINPGTSFTLRNDVTGLLILNSPKSPDIVGSFRHLHPELSDSFTLLKVSKNKVSIEMLIQKELISSKKFQYVYVNKRPAKTSKILRHVHKAICKKNIGKTKSSVLYNTKKYPVYVMNIKCPQSCVDNLIGPAKTEIEFTCWDLVLICIDKIIKTFLGLGEDQEKMPVQEKIDRKFSCGVSQLLGAVQASAFKRKGDETRSEEDDEREVATVSKLRRLDDDEVLPKPARPFVKDKTTCKVSQMSGNYQIEDSGNQQQPVKPLKVKSIIRKPLGINVKHKSELKLFGKENCPNREINRNQFDQHSVYPRLNADEDLGKDLIMDMFLKSTQVFKGENQEVEKISTDVSRETIEESNFRFENNIQDTVKGINTTMSISVNVKKRRLKNLDSRASKYVQTSLVGDGFASRHIQTSPEPAFNCHQTPIIKELAEDGKLESFTTTKDVETSQKPGIIRQGTYLSSSRFNRFQNQPNLPETSQKAEFIRQRGIRTACGLRGAHNQRFDNRAPDDVNHVKNLDSGCFKSIKKLGIIRQTASKVHKQELPVAMSENNKVSSKYVQTSQNLGWSRQKSYQTDLAARFDGFTLGCNNSGNVKDNYTILINTVHKKREYMFVRSEEMEVDGSEKSVEFRPLKICHCDKEDENFFRFPKDSNRIGTQLSVKERTQKPQDYQRTTAFRKPFLKPKAINVDEISLIHQLDPLPKKRNLLFRGVTRHPPPKSQTRLLYAESPYFFKKNKVQLHANVVPEPCKQSSFEQFQPIFKSTQISRGHFQHGRWELPHTKNDLQCVAKMLCYSCNHKHKPTFKDCFKCLENKIHQLGHANANYKPCCHLFDGCNNQNHHDRPLVEEMQNIAYLGDEIYTTDVHGHSGHKQKFIGMERCGNIINFPNNNMPEYHLQRANNNCIVDQVKITQPPELGFARNNVAADYDENLEYRNGHLMRYDSQCMFSTPSKFQKHHEEQNLPISTNKKMFNFKLSGSPNIFSSEAVKTAQNNSKSDKPNEVIEKNEFEDLATLCDLADFGLAVPKKLSLSKEASELEISIPNSKERHEIVEKELLQDQNNNRNNFFSCESEIKVIDRSKVEERRDERSRIIVDSQNEWLRQVNENGTNFFINKRTGMVTSKTPAISEIKFDFDERLDFIPKGMSPVLKEHKKIEKMLSQNAKSKLHNLILEGYGDELLVIKWQNFINNDPKMFFKEIYKEKTKQYETCIPSIHNSNIKIPKDFMSFSNNMFGSIETIGQVDKKFIAVRERTKDLLILFDQHAVHERIRVERFLKEYTGIKTPYKEKLTIFLPHNDLSLLKKHLPYIKSLGLGVELFTNGLHITDVPLCVKEKFSAEANFEDLNKVLNMLVKDTVEFLRCTRGSSTNLKPRIIQNIINLKACRGAIKFGDALSVQDCINLLRDLSTCKLPFQCAHGRPTLTPVLTLGKAQLKVKMKKLALQKLLLSKTS